MHARRHAAQHSSAAGCTTCTMLAMLVSHACHPSSYGAAALDARMHNVRRQPHHAPLVTPFTKNRIFVRTIRAPLGALRNDQKTGLTVEFRFELAPRRHETGRRNER
jgi:hypothetical protein